MANKEIEIVQSILDTQQPARVLEWGAGASTLYWPRHAPYVETWISIEHRPEYWHAVNVALDHDRALGERVICLHRPEESYVTLPDIEEPFNMILVDGQRRVECLWAAAQRLAPRGVCVLHDAGRQSYQDGWGAFRFFKLLYPGEIPDGPGNYKHRGVAVFWNDRYVPRKGWCTEYA